MSEAVSTNELRRLEVYIDHLQSELAKERERADAYRNAYLVARNYLVQSRDNGKPVDTDMVARPYEIVEKYEGDKA